MKFSSLAVGNRHDSWPTVSARHHYLWSFGWFFSQPPLVSFFVCPDLYLAERLSGTLYRALFVQLSLLQCCSVNTGCLGISGHSVQQVLQIPLRCLHPTPLPGNSFKEANVGLPGFVFLKDHSPLILVYCLMSHYFIYICWFIAYFRWRISLVSAPSLWWCESKMCWMSHH